MVYPFCIWMVYTWYIHGISIDGYTWYILGYPWISLDIPVFLSDQQCFIAHATLAIVPGGKVIKKGRQTTSFIEFSIEAGTLLCGNG